MSEITIIIPCYNHGLYLREAIESVRGQTVPVAGIVVVDDGSDDPATLRVVEELKGEDGVKVFRQENQGPAAARNRAIREVQTPFVASLDADDRLLPTFVETLLPKIVDNDLVGIAYGEARSFGAGEVVRSPKPYRFPEVLLDPSIYSTAIFRVADWKSVGGFCEEMRSGWEDFEFWVSLIELGKEVVYEDQPVFEYRRHDSSRDLDFSASRERVLDAFETIYRNHPGLYSENIRLLFAAHLERLEWRSRFETGGVPELRFEQCGKPCTVAGSAVELQGDSVAVRFPCGKLTPDRGEVRFDPFDGPGHCQVLSVRLLDNEGQLVREFDHRSCRIAAHSFARILDGDEPGWSAFFFLGRDPYLRFEFEPEAFPSESEALQLEVVFRRKEGNATATDFMEHLGSAEQEFNQSANRLRGAELELHHVKQELEKELAKRRSIQASRGYRIGRFLSRFLPGKS